MADAEREKIAELEARIEQLKGLVRGVVGGAIWWPCADDPTILVVYVDEAPWRQLCAFLSDLKKEEED